jgi:hypothetical protein
MRVPPRRRFSFTVRAWDLFHQHRATRGELINDANAGGVNPLDPVIRLGGERFSDLNLGGRS